MKKLTKFIKHTVDCEYYGNNICSEVGEVFDELYNKLDTLIKDKNYLTSKEKYFNLIEEVSTQLANFCDEVDDILKTKIEEIAETESEWLIDFMASFGIGYLKLKGIASKLEFMPYAETSDYKNISQTLSSKIYKNIESSLKTAYLTKESLKNTANRILEKKEKNQKSLDIELKTFNTGMFRNVDSLLYEKNNQKVKYISVLDSHTCLVCGMNHGKTFNIDNAPSVPVHCNCRCSLIPVEICDDKINTFDEFLSDLDETEQKNVLGKSRYELYKNGIPITDFVDNGRLLTLDELKNT